jgi:hypothetical protein
MVENQGKNLDKSTKNYKVTTKNIKNDLYRLEFEDLWDDFDDWSKIKFVLKNSEDEIIEWHQEQFEKRRNKSIEYGEWKKKIINAFSSKRDVSEFLNQRQAYGELAEDFLKRLKIFGRELELKDEIILGVFKTGLIRNREYIKLAIIGETEIKENLIKKIKEAEAISEEKYKRKTKKKSQENKQTTEAKNKGTVNLISQDDLLNKENSVYIFNVKINCLMDTGAEDNYITKKILDKCQLKYWKLNPPEERRTCLNEKFLITEKTRIKFTYNKQLYEEEFYILPKRNDELIILGTQWIGKTNKKIMKTSDSEDIDCLIDKLCERGRSVQGYTCRIETTPGKIVVDKPFKIEQAIEGKVEEEVERLLKFGYIAHSTSTWLNRVKPVEKPNGKIRLTANFISLNNLVLLDKYSLPDMMEMIYKLKNKTFKTKIDLQDGFYQIPLHPEDRYKTAFRIKNRLYEWTRMPMGFKNSPAVFQRYMDTVLGEEIGKSCFVYVDDILVFGETEKEHDAGLRRVIKKLIGAGLVANKDKIELKKKDIIFLGHKLVGNKIISELDNGQAIKDMKSLTNVDDVRTFLGTVNYYRKYIDNCATISEPLSRLLKKKQEFIWGDEQKRAFEKLKEELLGNKILFQPDFSEEFYLETDASGVGLGVILSQMKGEDKMPIMYASRTLSDTERNYSISEREMLAALWGMEKFSYFLRGRSFTLITDHIALKALNEKGEIKNARISRWIERIQQFNFKVEYKPGESIPHVDGLSRLVKTETVNQIQTISSSTNLVNKIIKLHEDLVHRGAKITTEEFNKVNEEKITEMECREVLNKCIPCKLYNPLRVGSPQTINSFEMGDKVAFDIIGPFDNRYIITAIDYFTRYGFAKVIANRSTKKVVKFLEEVNKIIPIKTLISDGAKENTSKELQEWCDRYNIIRHITTPHHHQSNGRVERFNRTILEAINKQLPGKSLKSRLLKTISVYNRVTHSRINMSPEEARNPNNWRKLKEQIHENIVKENSMTSKTTRKLYQPNDEVFIKNEIHKYKGQPKFEEMGIVTESLGHDTYKIKLDKGRYIKRHADQLRAGERS